MPILPASYDDSPLPSLNNVGGIQVEGVDPSATAEADAAAAESMQDFNDRAELRSALRSIRRYAPPKITSLYNQPNVANSPRFARSTFYGGSTVGDPILPGGYTPPNLSPEDGTGPSSPLFPQTPVDPLTDPLTLSTPGPVEEGNILVEPKPEGLPEPETPLDEEASPEPPDLGPEEPVADPTAMNDLYRKFNPGRLYRVFSV
jgi:hypothetical protein